MSLCAYDYVWVCSFVLKLCVVVVLFFYTLCVCVCVCVCVRERERERLNVTQITYFTKTLYICHFLTTDSSKMGDKFNRNILHQSKPSTSFLLCVIAETSLSLQTPDGCHENILHSPIQSESGLRTL